MRHSIRTHASPSFSASVSIRDTNPRGFSCRPMHLAFCVTTLQYRMMMHHRLGESPGLDQNEPTTATTAVILWNFQKPSSALKSNTMAHCALAACRVVRVPMKNLAEILNSRSAVQDKTSTQRCSLELVLPALLRLFLSLTSRSIYADLTCIDL